MKLCVVILSGAADEPAEAGTPLAAAELPVLDNLVAHGRSGALTPFPPGWDPSPEAALGSLLGFETPPPAGPILARAVGAAVGAGETVWRCDLVNLYDGGVFDSTSGELGDREAGSLFAALEETLGEEGLRFLKGAGWRGLLVAAPGRLEEVRTIPPASIAGEALEPHLPAGEAGGLLRRLMQGAEALLAEHEINAVRVDLGENPATGIWIWGGGRMQLPSVPKRKGVALGDHPALAGLAPATGLRQRSGGAEPKDVARAASRALGRSELVVVLEDGALRASRSGDARAKREHLARVDRELLAPLASKLVGKETGRLLVVGGHVASSARRRDLGGEVPFVFAGPGVGGYQGPAFSEEALTEADLRVCRTGELLELATRT